MELKRLRTLHMENPVGIDEIPYFSWILVSDQMNVMQKSWRIRVTDETGHLCWDSNVRESDQNTFVNYEGEPLQSASRYQWQLDVNDNYENAAMGTGSFETAILHDDEWKAVWVESALHVTERKEGFGNQPPASMFRRAFQISSEKRVQSARIYCTSRGVYRLFVNGQRPDDRELAPGYASYDRIVPYQTFDVTAHLQPGENVLGMYVGDGWFFNQETAIHKAETASARHAVFYELRIRYKDGSQESVFSDGSEKTAYGPVCFSDLFAGERYDARLEQTGWCGPEFDDTGWLPAERTDEQSQTLKAAPDDAIGTIAQIPAERLFEAPNGDLLADFGQNIAGRVRARTALPEGVRISLEHFEVTDPEGNYFNTICATNGVGAGADQRAEYVSDGEKAVYEPFFTYFGFRYVRIRFFDPEGRELTGAARPAISADDLTAIALSTRKENLGAFSCSDERLNRLYANIRWSQNANMLSIPTDCPQREKAGWTGDAGIYIGTALLNEDVTPLFARWLKSVEADQQEDGAVPMVVPFNETYRNMSAMMAQMTGTNGHVAPAGWGDACVKIP